MNVVDSSAWLEYFANGPNAPFFARPIEATDELVVPSLTIYEVFKRVLQQRDEGSALRAIAVMQQGAVVDLDTRLAMNAARVSISHYFGPPRGSLVSHASGLLSWSWQTLIWATWAISAIAWPDSQMRGVVSLIARERWSEAVRQCYLRALLWRAAVGT